MKDNTEIKKDIGIKKDLEVFAKSEGGEKYLASLRLSIVQGFYKLMNAPATDKDGVYNILADMKGDIRIYKNLTGAEKEVDMLIKILEEK